MTDEWVCGNNERQVGSYCNVPRWLTIGEMKSVCVFIAQVESGLLDSTVNVVGVPGKHSAGLRTLMGPKWFTSHPRGSTSRRDSRNNRKERALSTVQSQWHSRINTTGRIATTECMISCSSGARKNTLIVCRKSVFYRLRRLVYVRKLTSAASMM